MNTIKILIVSFFEINHLGGITTYISELRKGLENRGHTVDFIAFDPRHRSFAFTSGERILPSTVRAFVRKNLTAYSCHTGFPTNRTIMSMELRRYLLELSCALHGLAKYDVIHAQDVFAAYALSRVKPEQVPLVLTTHGAVYDKQLLNSKNNRNYLTTYVYHLERIALIASDKIICPSEWMAYRLQNTFQISSTKLSVIRYGLDIDIFQNSMVRDIGLEKSTDKKVILCSARIAKEKGLSFLLHALHSLQRVRDDWVCWIAGDGHAKQLMLSLSNHLDLQKNIRFLGRRMDIAALLKQADLFVLPSLLDNQPYAIIEAQIAGKATIATKTGGIPEMITHGNTGLLVPPANVEGLVNSMVSLLENDSYREQLGDNAQKWAKHQWPLSKMIDRTINFYSEHKLSGVKQ